MSSNDKTDNIESLVNERVEEKLEKEKLYRKLDLIVESSSIFPDIIKSLSDMRRGIEKLTTDIMLIKDGQEGHFDKSKKGFFKTTDELNKVFEKIRILTDEIENLENKLIDKNNSNSLVEVIKTMMDKQNSGMTDQNNPNSIVSLLKKSGKIQSFITWGLITIVTILGIVNKIVEF